MSDEAYIDSYARTDIHAEMLEDRERTHTYRRALLDLDLRGKTVLDVGCGTGILSLFAAESGAEHVYAVEASDLADVTRKIIADNGFDDRITVLHGKLEDIELPGKVDVIVSEWMGYFLIFERMLDSVLVARDRWLKPGGLLLPGTSTLFVAGIEDFEYHAKRFGCWDEVYGFDLSAMVDRALAEAVVEHIEPEALVTDVAPVLEMNHATMDVDDQDFDSTFTLKVQRTDRMHGLMAAFECTFNEDGDTLILSTAPFAPQTHWKQTLFYFDRPLSVRNGDVITGRMRSEKHPKNPRGLRVRLDVTCGDQQRSGTYIV